MVMMEPEQLGYPSFGTQYADDRMAMELPDADQPWPPPRWNPILYDYRVWDAWWSGDPDKLMRAYFSLGENSPVGRQFFATSGEPGTAARPGQYRGGLIGSIRRLKPLFLGRSDAAGGEAHQLSRAFGCGFVRGVGFAAVRSAARAVQPW